MKKQTQTCKKCESDLPLRYFYEATTGLHLSQCSYCRTERQDSYKEWLRECEAKLYQAEYRAEEGMCGYKGSFMKPAKKSHSHIATEEGVVIRVAV